MARDPVCGMEVSEKPAAGKSEHMGKTLDLRRRLVQPFGTSEYMGDTYYFCSAACKKAFDASPAKYVAHETTGRGGHQM